MTLDQKYHSLLLNILNNGIDSEDRTGVGTRSIFGTQLELDISNNQLPALGLRRVAPRIAFEELMFMLNGKTQTQELEEKNINIWKDNTSREFLDQRGLNHLEVGNFGRMYGAQLRNFTSDSHLGYFDQLRYLIKEIKTNPTSRRIIATHYNPAEADMGALFPCHIMTQFNVDPGSNSLDILFWMRSSDVGFGLPYNLMYYAMFAHLVARLTGRRARRLIYQSGDAHLYKNQIESGMIDYMISGLPAVFENNQPRFLINRDYWKLEQMLDLSWSDVEVTDYNPRPDFKNKPGMAV